MKRFGAGAAAPLSLILAIVFPAMIIAALALAYYGFEHAERMSLPIETLFRETSREEAARTVAEFETRVDRPALLLFDRIAAEKAEPTLATVCDVDPGPAIESYLVL